LHKWLTVRSESLCKTPVFELYRQSSRHPTHGNRDFFVLKVPAWVNIIPVTDDGCVVMVRQYRHGVRSFTLEIPGGMVDPADRSPAEAARREMVEETGYDAEEIIPLGRVHPNPAIQDNLCFSFLACSARRVTRKKLDDGEATRVVRFRLERVRQLIAEGKITHALVIAAFCLLEVKYPGFLAGRAPSLSNELAARLPG